ncbi:DUF6185 family protein [Streptomyces sp. NPDC101158]|uniref:DUF6185 family protein n=1 Tax=Streptomyces sp. NPDC101158 TaxID=3366117 RepID=UPI003809269A
MCIRRTGAPVGCIPPPPGGTGRSSRRERRYWPTRAGLLLSLYQMGSASAQIALFVAQLVALVTIWQQLSSDPPVVLIDHQGPIGTSPGGEGASGH